jgi:uncharacterized DUF497 family protein
MLLRGDVYVCHIQSMNDMARLAGFHWHAGNDNDISHKHRVSRAAAEQVFFNDPVLIMADERHSRPEERLHALSRTDNGGILLIAFTLRDDRRFFGSYRREMQTSRTGSLW